MAFPNRRRHSLDGAPVADVADLVLGVQFLGERAQPLLPAGDEDAVPSLGGERAADLGADSARRARDDGDARYLQTRTARVADNRLPPASVASALSM